MMKMDREGLIDTIKGYLYHVREANDCLIVYQSICKAVSNRTDEVNLSPGFFNITLSACINAYLLELAKLFDASKNRGERTFRKLLHIIEQNASLFPVEIHSEFVLDDGKVEQIIEPFSVFAEIEKANCLIYSMHKEIDNLLGRRDRGIAHNDVRYFIDSKKIENDYPITFKGAKQLLSGVESFCNHMLEALCNETVICFSENADDLDCLLRNVSIRNQ